ncbi:MAG: hypothetical protein WAZ94_13330 [Phycisphaerales bacterium]
MEDYKRLRVLYENVRLAKRALHVEIAKVFAPGVGVTYWHGDHQRTGVVLRTDGDTRLLIRSNVSGKELWLEAWRVYGDRGGA